MLYVTNTTADIALKGVTVNVASGVLLKAAAGNWGNSGSNGGTVNLTADGQTLSGNVVADSISSANISLTNSSSLSGTTSPPHCFAMGPFLSPAARRRGP